MKLLYIYLKSASRSIDIGINLNPIYDVVFKEGRVLINKTDNKQIDGFYSSNIGNMNLIIGENGVGKTTLLDVIGEYDSNRRNRLSSPDDGWFMIYSVDDGLFLIEGENKRIINNFKGVTSIDSDNETYKLLFECKNDYLIPISIKDNLLETIYNDAQVLYYPSPKRNYYYVKYIDSTNNTTTALLHRERLSFKMKGLYDFIRSPIYRTLDIFKPMKFIISNPRFRNSEIETILYSKEMRAKGYCFDYLEYSPKQRFLIRLMFNVIDYLYERYQKDTYMPMYDRIMHILSPNYSFSLNYESLKEFMRNLAEDFSIDNKSYKVKNEYRKGINYYWEFLKTIEDCADIQVLNDFNMVLPVCDKEDKSGKIYEIYDRLWYDNDASFTGDIRDFVEISLDGMSSGEQQLLDLMATLYNIEGKKYNLIVMDEPELSMHPEWSRMLVKRIVDVLKTKTNDTYDIILSSHAPIVSSDFFKENIIKLRRVGETIKVENTKIGLAGNIGELFISEFYLDYPIGEFIKQKITKELQSITGENGYEYVQENYERLSVLSDEIDDPVIKKVFRNEINRRSKLSRMEYLQKEMKKIQKEIDSIEMEQKNDKIK